MIDLLQRNPWLDLVVRSTVSSLVLASLWWCSARLLLRIRRHHRLIAGMVRRLRGPARLLLVVVSTGVVAQTGSLDDAGRSVVAVWIRLATIVAVSWLGVRLIAGGADEIGARIDVERPDNLRARTLRTQLAVARRIVIICVLALAVLAVLSSFEEVRALSTTIVASAGLIGVVVGVAGRSTIGNLVAGVQIAISAPIRYDDVVVVEGQFGRVEEITLTYVVLRLWDQRRLVLPCLYFVEHPVENWTRRSSQLLATALLHLDPSVDLGGLRAELARLVGASPRWDGAVHNLQVVDTTPSTVVVRVLVSARDAEAAWDLRAELREGLLAFVRAHQPHALPRLRVEPLRHGDGPDGAITDDGLVGAGGGRLGGVPVGGVAGVGDRR